VKVIKGGIVRVEQHAPRAMSLLYITVQALISLLHSELLIAGLKF
jgi:hypothetical protein